MGNSKKENKRENTNIIFLKKEKDKDGKNHYVLTLQHTKDKEGKDIWFELDEKWNEPVRILGRLNDLMEKYGFVNLDFLDSILSLFKERIVVRELDEKTKFHCLKYFNSHYAYEVVFQNCNNISNADFDRLRMFLPKKNINLTKRED